MVLEVWRQGRKSSSRSLLAKGRLNMPLVNAVRVMLLEPEKSAQAPYPFRCAALSPVFTLEAHSACLLYEIPEKDFRCEISSHGATFGLSEGAMMALQKAALAKVPFEDETKKASPGIGSEVVFLTPDDLKNTAQGRANVQRYLCAIYAPGLGDNARPVDRREGLHQVQRQQPCTVVRTFSSNIRVLHEVPKRQQGLERAAARKEGAEARGFNHAGASLPISETGGGEPPLQKLAAACAQRGTSSLEG